MKDSGNSFLIDSVDGHGLGKKRTLPAPARHTHFTEADRKLSSCARSRAKYERDIGYFRNEPEVSDLGRTFSD